MICTRYEIDVLVSFYYLVYCQVHGLQFNNKLTEEPLYTKWLDFQQRASDAYSKWYEYWINIAETTDRPVFFFRFEDVVKDPAKELKEVFRFILGMESIEGTVIERRVDEVAAWSAEQNQSYKPRTEAQTAVNKNLKNFRQVQLDQMKSDHEKLFHIFGYVKHAKNDNKTPLIDYEGKASKENVDNINYYKKLNEMAWKRRMKIPNGDLPEEKILTSDALPGRVRVITQINVMPNIWTTDMFDFTGV